MMSKRFAVLRLVRSRRGSGTITAMLVVMLLFVLGMSFASLSMSSLLLAKRDVVRAQAFSSAESGVELAMAYIMDGGPGGEAPGAWRTGGYSFSLSSSDSCTVSVLNGSGATAGKILIVSAGTSSRGDTSVTRTVEVVVDYRRDNVCPWNNAVFGGVGQAGKSINGNTQIRGSVHLLGDGEKYTDVDGDGKWDNTEPYSDTNDDGAYNLGEPYTDVDGDGHRDAREPFQDVNGNGTRDPALTVTDLASEISGDAQIGNNYTGMPIELRSKIPAPPTVTFAGDTLCESLSSKLRVKHGRVNISGSASVGDPNNAGDSIKETVTGTYVSDGFGGTAGASSVHSDNGSTNGYDLGDGVVEMPAIIFDTYVKDGVTYPNYVNYLRNNATVLSGDIAINNGSAFSMSGPNGSLTIDAAGNMTISGIVFVDGSISFGPKNTTITYEGSGTLVTTESAYVHCNLLPKTTFPTSDALGLIALDKVELATGPGDSQLKMAIAMYAQHKIISTKQNEIAGTMVSSYYEMSNVPKLYQVPELADHLPPGMPGAEPIWIVSIFTESWQER